MLASQTVYRKHITILTEQEGCIVLLLTLIRHTTIYFYYPPPPELLPVLGPSPGYLFDTECHYKKRKLMGTTILILGTKQCIYLL